MSLLKKLAGDTAIYGVSSILSRMLNFLVMTYYLTGAFPPEEYGVYSEMYAYVSILIIFFTYRMETAFFRFGSRDGNLDRAFSTGSVALFITTIILTILFVLAAPVIGPLLDSSNYQKYLIWFAFIVAFDALAALPFARLRLTDRPVKFAVLKTLSILVNIISLFFFLEGLPRLIAGGWEGGVSIYDPNDRIKYVFIANFFGSAITLLFLLPDYFKIKFDFDKALLKKMLIYAAPLIVVSLAAAVNQQLNIPLVKFLATDDEALAKIIVGEYSACFKIAMLMSLAIQAFNYAAEPFFFNQSGQKNSKKTYADVGQAFALAGSFIFLGILLYLDIFKHLIRDPDYWVALKVVPILLLANFFLGLYYNFSIWYKLRDQTIMGAYISVSGSIITLVLNFLLIPKLGYMGAAYTAMTCYAFMAAASYLTGQRYYPVPYPIRKMLTYIALAVLIYFISEVFKHNFELSIPIFLLINTGLLLVYAFIIAVIERDLIKNIRNADQ